MAWIMRDPNGRTPKYSSPEYFSIKLNHGGNIVRDIIEYYVGGTVSYIDYCDRDRISATELQSMSKEVGYGEEVALFYKVQNDGKWVFKKIQTDGDVTTMVESLRNDLVEVYMTDNNLEDNDYEFSEDDDALFDANVDKDIEWCGVRQKKVVRSDIPHNCLSETESEEGDSSDGFMSFDSSSDEDRKVKPKFRKYRPVLGKVQPIIEEKMIFKNRAQCVEAIRQHAIVNGKAITFEKNDTDRVRTHCVAPCPWNILASSITGDRKTLQVKTLNLNHNQCGWNWTNKLMNSSWLARTYFKEFKIKPSWPVNEMVEQVMGDYIVKISPQMAYNARKKAVKKIEGSYAEQYEKLWDYCGEMSRTNPGTSKGFIEGCRPIIGVDGCHLKGPHGGQLLAAVGIDGNNQIYPVAYAMVEVEEEASWSWFLEHLKNDLQIPNQPTFTIISDKQKGLMNAIRDLLPCVEHRHCVRHLHSNMKRAGYTGQAIKDRLWNLARATYMGRFSTLMEECKKEDGAAFKWLAKHEPHHWSRSHFNVAPKCDMLLNNLCESFNAAILDAKDKPILTMLERIRIYMIRHLVKRRASVEKWHGQIGPKIVKLLDKNIALCSEYIVVLTGDNQFEVRGFHHGNQFCVDMNAKTCTCRRWDLTGIPCAHALAVLRDSKKKAEGLVHDYYQKQAYINTYKHVIYPMNGMDMWEKTNKPPIEPPHYTRKSGRPKKCKMREPDEPLAQSDGTKKMKRYLTKLSCRRCGGKGHNVRTCPSGFTTPMSKEQQSSQPISQPMFTQPLQPTPKAPCRRGGIAKRGGAARRGGAP
ncbi:hypothetical protein RHMOL_Rhmol10G0174400 [Rhododendron molle]|uniref:Uncharacterized protein n=1 Tax=Rhododendron molle TaxID=49168 RepID=A0ACC0M3T6_RHOML|nr:hypothetical protein RHMOL_Rhmol10G0174400 [Rhododendron molle]